MNKNEINKKEMTDNISDIMRNKIEIFTYGYVFTAVDFPVDVTKQKSVNKVLENLTKTGKDRTHNNAV